jgi:ABC-type antimicrobial peptide transport system permease subunit
VSVEAKCVTSPKLWAVAAAALLGSLATGQNYGEIIADFRADELKSGIEQMTRASRLGGPRGSALEWARRAMAQAGEVREEAFTVTIPDPNAVGTLAIGDTSITVHPLWPNGVRTSTCDFRAPVVYAGRGTTPEFDGKAVRGSIVILEFESEQGWNNAARLGAKAVVFIEPALATRGEIETKWSEVPTNIPRFWAPRKHASLLRSAAGTADLKCKQDWVDFKTTNLMTALRGHDPKMRDEWVVISAYIDGASGVPGLAPGADQSAGIVGLNAIIRHFKANNPKRSVLFLATSAHFQGMQGMRSFIENRFEKGWDVTGGAQPLCIYTLDLSTRSSSLSTLAKGWWFDYRDENHENERPISRALMQYAPKIAEAMRMPVDRVAFDGINNPDGRHWKNNVPGRFGVESEIINMAGPTAITFMTNADVRDHQDTPHDTIERVNTGNLLAQVRTIACFLRHALNDTQDEASSGPSIPYRGGRPLMRMSLMAGFGTVEGRVLRYDPKRSFLPDVPVTGAIVEYPRFYRNYMGIRGTDYYRASGSEAEYRISGVPTVTAWANNMRFPVSFMAYATDEHGEISYATDYGIQGEGQFAAYFLMTTSHRDAAMVVFPCVPVPLFGLVDPHQLKSINYLNVMDARNNGSPPSFSFLAPLGGLGLRSFVENSAIIFAPHARQLKVAAGAGYVDTSLLLLNATSDQFQGIGIVPGDPLPLGQASLQSAHDFWWINEWRRGILKKHHIANTGLDALQARAGEDLESAKAAFGSNDFSKGSMLTQQAWGRALRAHPQYRKTISDIVNGLVFFLALLLPFCYFMERLLFSSARLSRQVLIGAILFIGFFGLMRLLHPAFDITGNTFMIFVAFAIGALSLIVTTFVVGKFEVSLQKLQQVATGVHDERVGKVSLAVTALSIGISNMRRRKARTILTSATLVLVTFIVLSFTSVVSDFRFNETDAEGTPRYSGVLVRDRELAPIENSAFEFLTTEFSGRASVSRRAWFYGGTFGSLSALSLRRGTRSLSINALLGLDANESGVSRPQEALMTGRWFRAHEREAAVMPLSLANRLGVSAGDVGHATVTFGGVDLSIIGIVDDALFKSVVDLDNESIIPADFTQSRQMQDRGQGGEFAFRKYVRYDPGSVLIVPASFALGIGAELRSVGIGLPTYAETATVMADLMPRMSMNLYAGVLDAGEPAIKQFSTVASTKSRGFEYVVIPVLIAAIIVLNTMIASVLERQREIAIFSAVGLSPKQISALFFAESLVYAVIGAVSGYLLALAVGAVIARTGWFGGLSLNYSSLSAVYAVMIVVAVVLLSTLYPAKRAREIATPSGDGEWFADPPTGDHWRIVLPFTVSQSHASALALFYAEWLRAYEDYNIGDFVTENVRTLAGADEYRSSAKCWLAPFDLGVQQEMSLVFKPTDMSDVYSIVLEMQRLSGDPENWETLNRRFLRSLRKQFLVWRTLSPDEKLPYLQASIAAAP